MNFFYNIGAWATSGLRRLVGMQYSAPAYTNNVAEPVTFDSAMQISTYWACVKLIAETIASLPLVVYKTTETGRKIDENHQLNVLFSRKPNRYQTKIEFFETVLLNLIVNGNAYCYVEYLGDRIVSLMPLMSSQMEVELLRNGDVVYKYTQGEQTVFYSEKSIWHLKLIGNGIVGLSPLDYQRKSLGITQAQESLTTTIYKNGGKASGAYKVDKWLTPEQRTILRESYKGLTEGGDRLIILEGGTDFKPISLSPQDIELLSSRKHQINEICRWLGVPPVLVGERDGSIDLEKVISGFYKVTLRPIIEKIESSIHANLLTVNESARRYAEFDLSALTRTDVKTRYEAYRIGVYGGYLTPNEIRAWEGLDAKDGGDELIVQGANVLLTDLDSINGVNDGNQTTRA